MIEFRARLRRGESTLDLEFTAPAEGVTVLFGPSGSGKTSALALLAGALWPDEGRIAIHGEALTDTASGVRVPLERRRIGWVFQDGRLFPHLRVRDNLLFGARHAGAAADGVALDFDAVVGTLDLPQLLQRWPRDLSGGERQRVALGRALLARPRLLLLDEPLASLDAARKSEILTLLERIKRETPVPIFHVTHSLAEALRLADHLVLLEAGRVVAQGRATDLLGRGDTPGLAQRPDAGSLLLTRIVAHDAEGRWSDVSLGAQRLRIGRVPASIGDTVRCYVLANDVMLATVRPLSISVRNILATTVRRLVTRDVSAVHVELDADGTRLLATVTPAAVAELGLVPGAAVFALVKSVSVDAPAGLRMLETDHV